MIVIGTDLIENYLAQRAGHKGSKAARWGKFHNPEFSNDECVYDGEWKAAGEALEEALDLARNIGAKWDELNGLGLRAGFTTRDR